VSCPLRFVWTHKKPPPNNNNKKSKTKRANFLLRFFFFLDITAKRDFDSSSQLYMSYGTRDATQMMVHSGFIPDPSPAFKSMFITVCLLSNNDVLFKARTTLLTNLGLDAVLTIGSDSSNAESTNPSRNIVFASTTRDAGIYYRIDIISNAHTLTLLVGIALMSKLDILNAMKMVSASNKGVAIDEFIPHNISGAVLSVEAEILTATKNWVSTASADTAGLWLKKEIELEDHSIREDVKNAAGQLRRAELRALENILRSLS
jgi:hypothetical protein